MGQDLGFDATGAVAVPHPAALAGPRLRWGRVPAGTRALARRRALRTAIGDGPAALVVVEDACLLRETFEHLLARGFEAILAFAAPAIALPEPAPPVRHGSRAAPRLLHVEAPSRGATAASGAANAALAAARPGAWLHLCYNAEFLFHPFCEHREVGDMLAFHAEERRAAMLTTVVDLYPADLSRHPGGVTPVGPGGGAHLDGTGYHAVPRRGPDGAPLDRQIEAHGGLRWRFADHLAGASPRIDRTGLFRARRGLRMGADHLLNDAEANTRSCPWHRNLTAAICSFRAAKALRASPVARAGIERLDWPGSVPFAWSSRQLEDLGLMEPGQWF